MICTTSLLLLLWLLQVEKFHGDLSSKLPDLGKLQGLELRRHLGRSLASLSFPRSCHRLLLFDRKTRRSRFGLLLLPRSLPLHHSSADIDGINPHACSVLADSEGRGCPPLETTSRSPTVVVVVVARLRLARRLGGSLPNSSRRRGGILRGVGGGRAGRVHAKQQKSVGRCQCSATAKIYRVLPYFGRCDVLNFKKKLFTCAHFTKKRRYASQHGWNNGCD